MRVFVMTVLILRFLNSGELCWIMQKLFLKYLSSYEGRQAVHSCFNKIVFKMLFHYINFARFLLSYV